MEKLFRDDLILDAIATNEFIDKSDLNVAQILLKVGESQTEIDASQSNTISVIFLVYISYT